LSIWTSVHITFPTALLGMCKVGAGRTAKLCFPTPPSEPDMRRSPHPALQGLASASIVTDRFVMFFAFIAASIVLEDNRLTSTSGGTKQLIDRNIVNPLAPFALYAAFPRSDYYGASDAHALHWGTAPLPA
jgi:hypothetical protein